MPKQDLVKMTCEYCGFSDTFDIRSTAEVLLPKLQRWYGLTRGDMPPGQGADGHEWYCSDCVIPGFKMKMEKEKDADEHQAKLDAALQKADKELKASPFMVKN